MAHARVSLLDSGPELLRLRVEIQDRRPAEVFRDWVEPARLRIWWPPEAEVDPRVGGRFVFRWPKMNWTLRGTYLVFNPDHELRFTWTWDHEPDLPKEVAVTLARLGSDGTVLDLTHSRYSDDARDRDLREEHLEGWKHFLARLGEVAGG